VREVNLRQRHLTEGQQFKLALAMKPDLEEHAKLNMALGGKGVRIQTPLGRTLKRIAELAEDYLKGNITANKAYRKIIKAQALTEKKAELAQAETLTEVPVCDRSSARCAAT
jgi:hypothetical protein